MDVFGFALAWVMTTAAGSLVIGHVMARSQPPVVVHVPDVAQAAEAPDPRASCPQGTWEPPVVAVGDLPVAPQSRPASPRFLASNDASQAAVTRPPQEPIRRAAAAKAWSAAPLRRVRYAGATLQNGTKAKAPPRTLEEWMRASLDSG